uniref:Protein RIC1 homolog n=1 Tax=Globodera pallida TaxID=36090 RepID=A0A183BVV3_GLOPA
MFLPDSCDSLLRLPCSANVNYVVANRERTIVAVVSDENLYFYFADTRLLACIYQRDGDNLRERGPFTKAFWKPDSRSIFKKLFKHFLSFSRGSSEFYLVQNRPLVNVTLLVVAHLEAEPTSVLSFKEEFIVCLVDGWLHRMSWTGTVLQNLSFNIRSICATPNQFGKDERHSSLDSLHVLDIAPFLGGICVVLSDGRGALLRSPSANFQPNSINALWAGELNNACCCATNFKYRLIYFGTKSGDVVTYSLDDLNETLVQLFVVRLTLKNGTEFLGRLSSVRQIRCLSPNGSVFAVIWNSVDGLSGQFETLADLKKDADCCHTQNGTETNSGEESRWLTMNTFNETPPALAIFSPFGAQWWCSLEDHSGSSSSFSFTTLDWAHEGFQLWMGTTDGVHHINLIQSAENSHSRHVMMFGSDRVYLSPSISADQTVACSAPHLIWKVFKPPHNYLAVNGPIMLMATDFDCNKLLAVAGRHGFCLYNFKSAKWRMFRKEAQEQSLSLGGGLAIFEDFVICSACNTDFSDGENERIYAFHAEKQLDLDVANSITTNKVLQMSLNHLHLLVFDVNSLIGIYSLSLSTEKGQNDSLTLECLAEIRIAEFLPHPNCLVSMDLTRLNFHSDAVAFCEDLDSLLLNISGHLLLLSPMQPQLNDDGQSGKAQESDDEIASEFQLHPPTLIASFVEHFWTTMPSDRKYAKTLGGIAFLEDALWINAGFKNSKIWLPLSTEQKLEKSSILTNQSRRLSRQSSRSFISRRIMLPIDLDIYPLCVNDDYLACGASCVSSRPKASSASAKLSDNISLATEDGSSSLSSFVTKNDFMSRLFVHNLVRVFIHKLLKQLLKRNLGAFAFDLATACRSLSYFGHILELLLHDLLDEEATSSEPIPDPLLPTAVAFLREFPAEYLRTIVFCARKTELAFWSLLFSISQHPRQLFQMCLQEGQLDTATSCLMILHSMENFKESSKLAFRLLEEALAKRQWTVAQDIVRFMHSICRAADHEMGDIGAVSEGPESPLQHKLSSLQSHHHFHQSKPSSGFNSAPADEFAFHSFSSSAEIDGESSTHRHRSMSSGKTVDHPNSRQNAIATTRQNQQQQHNQQKAQQISPPSKEKLFSKALLPKLNTTKPSGSTKNGRNLVDGYEKTDKILAKYAATLLEDYALRDLGAFSSYLQFDLISFLRKNAFSVAAAEFPVVLMKLHAQFNWPYPVSFSANLPVNHSSLPFNGSRISNGSTAIPSFVVDGRNAAEGDENEAKTGDSDDERVQKGCSAAEGVGGSALIFCNWKVLEKFCSDSKVRGTAQTEAEMAFVLDILQKTEAFEWIFLLCILCQDIRQVKERILTPMQRLPEGRLRMEQFLKRVRAGTQQLFQWAQFACPAYSTVMRVFKEFKLLIYFIDRMGGVNRNLANLLGGGFAAVPFHFAPHFRWALFGIGFTILGLAKGIILPPGAHLQSLSPVESAELGAGCGRSTETLAPRRGRAHPWAVSFMTKGRNRLGGTIISPWHILTVAHGFLRFDTTTSGKCDVYGYRNFETLRHGWTVVYGDDCIWQQQHDYLCARPNLTQNRIRAIFVDDGFADGVPIIFSDRVQPICLPVSPSHQRIADGEVLTVTSWGRRDAFHKGDPLIREIPLRHDAECKGRPWSDIMPTNVEDYLCAKALNPKDYHSARTCHGDSGSGMEWKKAVGRVVGTLLPQRPIPSTVPLPAVMPSSVSAFPSPSVELTNGSQPRANANGSVTHQITTSGTEKRMPMPLDNKRRRAKIHSRHVLRSPLAIPQLELMKKWRNSRRQNERPTEEAFLSHPRDDLVKLLLNRVEESGEDEQNPVEREDRSEVISRTDRSEVISKTELIGVTSFGSRQCASDELARFTRIAHYVKKICALTGVCYQLAGEERS